MSILITGGAGYIGSHTCVELIQAGYEVIVIDNFCNSNRDVIDRIEKITDKKVQLYDFDLTNKNDVESIFEKEDIEAVIHFAALKAVGESVELPIEYYINNLVGTLNLLDVMKRNNVKKMIFSSSATVYGKNTKMPLVEDNLLSATNPYGKTKVFIEEILNDVSSADRDWSIYILRYFNPIGAHESALIGENPNGIPNNVLPSIMQVACGKLEKLYVYGNDYDTPDGTGVRDYIHVVDLAKGHVSALKEGLEKTGIHIYNLGTGKGYSVLELITQFEKVSGKSINFEIHNRRKGDIATCYADPRKAEYELHWKAEADLEKMCKDSWNWAEVLYSRKLDK